MMECLALPQDTLRFLAFDCLVVDGQNVMERPLDRRYGVSFLALNLQENPDTDVLIPVRSL